MSNWEIDPKFTDSLSEETRLEFHEEQKRVYEWLIKLDPEWIKSVIAWYNDRTLPKPSNTGFILEPPVFDKPDDLQITFDVSYGIRHVKEITFPIP